MQDKEDETQLAYDDDSDSEHVLLMLTTKSKGDSSDHWYLNTGCTNHMLGRNVWFIDLNEKVKSKVKFGDNFVDIE